MALEDTSRTRAAVHEAGHALVAAARGQTVTSLKIIGDDGAGATQLAAVPHSKLDQLWILHGGPQAEAVAFGRWLPTGAAAEHDDIGLGYALSQRISVHNPSVMRKVREFLTNHRPGLDLITHRVLQVSVIEGDALKALLGQALRTK